MDFQRTIFPTCSGGFEDGLTGNCYSCPPGGYNHDPLVAVNQPGVCWRDLESTMSPVGSRTCTLVILVCVEWSYSGDTSSGGLWRGENYYKCTDGYSHDPTVAFNQNGICKLRDNQTATYFGRKVCDAGEINSGGACYECPDGYNHDALVPFNQTGICTRALNEISTDAGEYRVCDLLDGELENGGNCYECPASFLHDILVPFNDDGICKQRVDTVASLEGDIGFLCPAGEFLDLNTGDCYRCDADQIQDPLLPAMVPGVCYSIAESLPQSTGEPQLLCPSPQFADLVTGSCYSCPVDYLWNPLVPVGEPGVCFNLLVGEDLTDPTFQAGLQVDYDFALRWGVSGGVTLDAGSVNIDYQPAIEVDFIEDRGYSGDGQLFNVDSRQLVNATSLEMDTTVPGIEAYFDTHLDARARLHGEIAYPGISTTGAFQQENHALQLVDVTTGGEVKPNPDHPLIGAGLSLAGIHLDVLGQPITSTVGTFKHPFQRSLTFVSETPRDPSDPDGGDSPLSINYTIAEISLRTANFSTPVDASCRTLLSCLVRANGVEVEAPELYFGDHGQTIDIGDSAATTSINNYVRAGARTTVTTGEFLDPGLKINDLLKLEVDLDGLTTMATQVPFEINWAASLKLGQGSAKNNADAGQNPFELKFFRINGSIVDLDVAAVLNVDASFTFEPNLIVIYEFSRPVEVRIGAEPVTTRDTVILPLGESFAFVHPGDRLHVRTRYSLEGNRFTNNADLMLTPLLEGDILSGTWDFIGRPRNFPGKFSAASVVAELTPEPIKVLDLNFLDTSDRAVFGLDGFATIEGGSVVLIGDELADSDGDGMPDEYEILFGLNPNDAADGLPGADRDGDGVSSYDEYQNGTNPAVDHIPPTISAPPSVGVAAIGPLTPVDLGTPQFADNVAAGLSVAASPGGPFIPGRHWVTWTATDASDTSAEAVQRVDVLPRVELTGPAIVGEGARVLLTVTLNGKPPDYPVTVPYTVGGTSRNPDDHDSVSGEIRIDTGTMASLAIAIVEDVISESPETLVFTLGEPTNAALGDQIEHSIEIVEHNVAPFVTLDVNQGGTSGTLVAADGGSVQITALVSDVNVLDSHQYDWSTSDLRLVDSDAIDDRFTFATALLAAGIYHVVVTVTDDGQPVRQTTRSVAIRVLPTAPSLSAMLDSDGDGVSDADEGFGDQDGDGIPDYQDNLDDIHRAPAGSGAAPRLATSELGTRIRLGETAFARGQASIALGVDDFVNAGGVADEDFEFPGGGSSGGSAISGALLFTLLLLILAINAGQRRRAVRKSW